MIAETLAGIALVKSAVDGIKSAIGTANDIGDIAGHIDNLFAGEKQVQQERAKKAGVGISDQFGVNNVARDVIDAKIAAEKLQEVATMVDMRFGHGTWKGILAERQKRIQEAREAAAKARREAQRAHDEMMENVRTTALVSIVIGTAVGLLFLALAILPK
jgi:ElaB/YqjD/DUF883 family membrane-anchored ribosome-binding protein